MDKKNIFPALLGVSLALITWLIHQWGLIDPLELKSLDLRFRIRGPIPPKAPIVLVSIDQDSFDELNLPWPWPRNLHAQLVQKLTKSGAKIIGLDILFTEAKTDVREDSALAKAIKEAGNVILAAEITDVLSDFGPKTALKLPIPLLRESALGYGPINLATDDDGIVRRGHVIFNFQDRDYPTFAYRIYQAATAKKASTQNYASPRSLLVNFRGPARTFPVVPYYRIVNNEIPPAFFRGKIVLLGGFAASLHDVFPTPFSASQPMPGVEVQANIIETLLGEDPIVPTVWSIHDIIFLFLCAATIWISLQFSPLRAFAVVFALSCLFALGCALLFAKFRVWFPMTPSLFGIILCYGGLTLNNYIREQRERVRMRLFLNKYVSADVADELLRNRKGPDLSGVRRHITVLFSDLRDFTRISEKTPPEFIVAFLNEYLARITQIVFNHGGTVVNFMGDGVMAIFGAPKSFENDAARAVKAGLEMIKMIGELDPKWPEILRAALKIGVGINSGDAVVGSIGSELRAAYTGIGDTVNLASRLEGLTKEMGVSIIISEFTAAELKDEITLVPLRIVKVVGRETALRVYTVASLLNGQMISDVVPSEPYIQSHK